ncbi:MAG: DNA repair protein RecO [Anaerolineae bacterium]
MRDRVYRIEALILKRTDVGEADRLLTLYTPDRGKLRAVAKGARKPSSRKTGHVELLNRAALMVAVGRDLDVITQADTLESFLPLRNDLDRLSYAYYFAELVDRFTEQEEENRAVYDLLLQALRWLEKTDRLPRTARYFEMRLLDAVGYRPELLHCVNCRQELAPEENFFTPEGGGVLDPGCRDSHRDSQMVSLNGLKVLRFLQTRDYAEVDRLALTPRVEAEVEQLLHYNLTHWLERNLKSIEFLHILRAGTVSSKTESN